MSHLIAISFEDEHRADEVRTELLRLQREYLVDLEDAVVAIREPDGKVKLRQLYSLTTTGAVSGGFWGTLIGLIFLHPLFGLAIGAAAGAIGGALTDVGIDDKFMKELSRRAQPGSSVLFVLVRQATPDKVLAELERYKGQVLHTSLSHEDEQRLREAVESVSVS
jgi:uncharacterized membrane protein